MNPDDAVLITGGYGVVGSQLAELIRQRYPQLPLLLAGRSPARAEALAQRLGNAEVVALDVTSPNPLGARAPRAVIALVNDPQDALLLDVVRQGIPYLDITRWTENMKNASARLSAEAVRAPVLFASAWMAGVAALTAVALTRKLAAVESIDISILYALQDKAGPNSAEYMDRLATPYPVWRGGRQEMAMPLTDPHSVVFPGGRRARVYRIDTPEQFTLPALTEADTVAARIAFDNVLMTQVLVFLAHSGIWKLLSGERFTGLRRLLLYNPGQGAPHELVVEVRGKGADRAARTLRAEITDPRGQTHLTAVGALIQFERLLGLDGAPAPAAGVLYPDSSPNLPHAMQTLADGGVILNITA